MNVTQRYLTALRPQLSERDLAIIEMIGRFKVATGEQIERVFFADCSETSRARNRQAVLKRLLDRKVVERVGVRPVGGPDGGSRTHVYALAVAGQAIAGLASVAPRRPYVHYQPNVAHNLAVGELYVRLVEAERAGQAKLLQYDAEPYCWRDWGVGRTLKPDAFCKVGVMRDGQKFTGSFFIEVDRGDQWGTKISSKLPAYLAFKAARASAAVMPLVVFLSPNQRRVDYMVRLVAATTGPDAELFRCGLLDAFEHVLLG